MAKRSRKPKPQATPDALARDFLGLCREEVRCAKEEEKVGLKQNNEYARNKALQASGMAVEYVYKALLLANGTGLQNIGRTGHSIRLLHGKLQGDDKTELEAAIVEIGWPTVDRWLRYMDGTLRQGDRRYLMFDQDGRRNGIAYPTDGPASVDGICCIVAKAFDLADAHVAFLATKEKQRASRVELDKKHPRQKRGPLIGTINLPAGKVEEGEPLGGMVIDRTTGEVRILSPEETVRKERGEKDA